MTDIIAETEELMRQERLAKFWNENGKLLLAFAVLTVLATGLISAYRSWDARVRAKDTEQALMLMEAKDFPDNLKATELDMRPGLRGIVLINGAQAYLEEDKNEEALALYSRAAEDNAIPDELQDMALLMQLRLTKDAAANQELTGRLQKVASGNSPWQYHARLELAALQAGQGDYETARQTLAPVMDKQKVTDTLYKKAQALDHVYALQARNSSPPEEPKDEKEGS